MSAQDPKERLREVLQMIPADSQQRVALEEGIANMSPEEAGQAADRLTSAIAALPEAIAGVEAALEKRLKTTL